MSKVVEYVSLGQVVWEGCWDQLVGVEASKDLGVCEGGLEAFEV